MLRKFFTTVAVGSLFVGGLAATHVAFAQDGGPGPRGMRGGPMMMADANAMPARMRARTCDRNPMGVMRAMVTSFQFVIRNATDTPAPPRRKSRSRRLRAH